MLPYKPAANFTIEPSTKEKYMNSEDRRTTKMTILRREGGTWQGWEFTKLISGLMTEVYGHPRHSQYLVLRGHYTKEETLKALLGSTTYTATQVTGLDNKDLPFVPPIA